MSNCVIKCFYDTANNVPNTNKTKIALSIGGSVTQFVWSTFNDNKINCLNNLKGLLQKSGVHGIDFDIENQFPTKQNDDGSYDYSGLIDILRELKTNFKYTAIDGTIIGSPGNKLYLSIAVLVGNKQNKYYKNLFEELENENDISSDPLFDKIYLMNYNGGAWIEGHSSGTCIDNDGKNIAGYWDIWVAWWLGLKNYTELYGNKNTYSFDNTNITGFVAANQNFNNLNSKIYTPKRLLLGIITAESPISKSNPYNYNFNNIATFITNQYLGGYFIWWYSTNYDTEYLINSVKALSNINTVPPSPPPVCKSNLSSSSCNTKNDEHLYFLLPNNTSISFTFKSGSLSKIVTINSSNYENNRLYLVPDKQLIHKNTLYDLLGNNTNINKYSYHTWSNPITFEFDSYEDAEIIGLVKVNKDNDKAIFSSPQSSGCFSINIDSSKIKNDSPPAPNPPTGSVIPAVPKLNDTVNSILYTNVYDNFDYIGIPHVNYINLSSIVYDPGKDDFLDHLVISEFLCKGDYPPIPKDKCYNINNINIRNNLLNIQYKEIPCTD